MTSEQFKSLKVGDTLYGFHRGSHFAVRIAEIHENDSMTVSYASGERKWWSKTHIRKYYRLHF